VSELYVTYNNEAHTDGLGAQLFRTYGIYAVARHLGLKYIHSGLARIDHQGLAALETQTPDETLVGRANALFRIPDDAPVPMDAEPRDISFPDPAYLAALRQEAVETGRPILARLTYAHGITDQNPHLLKACAEVSPFLTGRRAFSSESPLRVAVHMRRGDVHILEPDRLLPNAYYIGAMAKLRAVLARQNIPHRMELHTELAAANFSVSAAGYGVYNMQADKMFDASVDNMQDFAVVEGLEYFVNAEAIESLSSIASADIIVTSKSCFSYLAGILNPNAVVLYYPFWHAPLPQWVVSGLDGDFDSQRMANQICADSGAAPA
jgi:hypothetical protein